MHRLTAPFQPRGEQNTANTDSNPHCQGCLYRTAVFTSQRHQTQTNSSRYHLQHKRASISLVHSPWGGGALPSLHSAGHATELEALAAGDGGRHHVRRSVLHESPGADVLANVLDAEDHRGDVAVLRELLGPIVVCVRARAGKHRTEAQQQKRASQQQRHETAKAKAGENFQVRGWSVTYCTEYMHTTKKIRAWCWTKVKAHA